MKMRRASAVLPMVVLSLGALLAGGWREAPAETGGGAPAAARKAPVVDRYHGAPGRASRALPFRPRPHRRRRHCPSTAQPGLAANGDLTITPAVAGNGAVHVLIDVSGYFE